MPLLQRGHAARKAPKSTSSLLSSGRPGFVAWLRGLTLLAELDMSLDPKLLPADIKSSLPQLCASSARCNHPSVVYDAAPLIPQMICCSSD